MTPIRRQYLRIKQRYLDSIVLFRLGDFYETFDEDARLASRELDIVLTSKSMGKDLKVPLAGIPAHSLDSYLVKLIKKGYKVAICEQLSDPASSKGLVERDVVRVVTPGTVVESSLLEQSANNYLVTVSQGAEEAGIAHVDITTGYFATTQVPIDELGLELDRLDPAEVVFPQDQAPLEGVGDYPMTSLPESAFHTGSAEERLLEHFGVATLESFGCAGMPLAVSAAGAILEYLAQTQKSALSELDTLNTYSTGAFMAMDQQTRRNLELFQAGRWGNAAPSLFSVLDLTRTPMGGRMLRRWIGQPLLVLEELNARQEGVAFFHSNLLRRESTIASLSRITDLERVLNRVRLGIVTPRDLVGLKSSLEAAGELIRLFQDEDASPIAWLGRMMHPCDDVVTLVQSALVSEPVGEPGEGNVIREGLSPDLDEVRAASRDAKSYIAGLERKEREKTGIRTLKVGYNRVFGYYIEVTNSNLPQVPEDYIRRQTLVGGERFITPELKEYESLILNARERVEELEKAIYKQVCSQIAEMASAIASTADGVAHIDAFAAMAEVASRQGYVRPHLTEEDGIYIKDGRHPVVERVVPPGAFVPNDTSLSVEDAQLLVITGPNMAGKSTYIRQVALIVLMAQIGSFVPAESATLGLVDRIFTRVGLQDDLATGQSTFMVEMVETASILNQATPRSLIILDEIGRGTSTYDGLSIARSVVEYMHNNPRLGSKTLFATHYHELTELAESLPRVRNYKVAVSEEAGDVVFLHRIVPGGADKSYGIHVARLAGLPRAVVNRAWEVLRDLEGNGRTGSLQSKGARVTPSRGGQMSFFNGPSPLEEELSKVDVSNVTPLEAINLLYELQKKARGEALSPEPSPVKGEGQIERENGSPSPRGRELEGGGSDKQD